MLTTDLVEHFDSLRPGQSTDAGATRRTALKLALGAGYAAAAAPIMAQTAITTSSEGLRTGQQTHAVAGFDVPFYFAAPEGKTGLPVVLVVHEIFGVHAYIADVCRRLAHAGYLAIAPSLFARQGDPAAYSEIPKMMAEVVSKVADAQVMADLDGVLQWAGSHGGNLQHVGITGFCWGGRITWLYCEHNPAVKAGVAWYGRMLGTASPMTPQHPIDRVADLKAPVLGLYGGKDAGIPLSSLDAMKQALAAEATKGNTAARDSDFVVYPEAGHAFHADYRASYVPQAAQDGFQRALAWFKAKGVA